MADEIPEVMPEQVDVDYILRDYHKRQLILHMIGPIISLLLHILVLATMSQVFTGQTRVSRPPIEVSIQEMEVVEIEKPMLEEIEILEEEIQEEAPEFEVPDAPAPTTESTEIDTSTIADDMPGDTADFSDLDFAETETAEAYTPLTFSGLMSNRTSSGRKKAMREYRAAAGTEDAVMKALRWLQSVQQPNGSWQSTSAHTGLALLCFLAHGETPLSTEFGQTVQSAMQWLANDMMSVDTNARSPHDMSGRRAYSHGIATYALAEAYGLTQIPFLRSATERGLERIIRGQQPGGGFDYRYAQGDRWDLSVGGWQVQAIKAGIAGGINLPGIHEAAERSADWIQNTTYANNKFGYSAPGTGGNMTGVGVVCLQLLGHNGSEVSGGLDTIATSRLASYEKFLTDEYEFDRQGHRYIYGWYYDTQAMFNHGGKHWRAWNRIFNRVLTESQHSDGYWETKEEKSHYGHGLGGTILITTWACLQLEVYYRYLPTFDISKMKQRSSVSATDSLLEDSGLIIE